MEGRPTGGRRRIGRADIYLVISMDFIKVHKEVPFSCRHPVTGNRFRYGCPQTVAWWLEPWTSTLAGISLGFCLLDFLVIGITVRVRNYIGMVKET